MSKLATRCSVILLSTGLLTACPQQQPPNTTVKPLPSTAPTAIVPTPPPGSVITSPTPLPPGATPNPSGVPSSPGATSNPNGLMIQTTAMPTGVLNFNYSIALQATGGSGSYRWNVVTGNLPNGLTLDQTTGQVFGRPTQTGTFSFEVQVVDNQRGTVDRRNLSVLVSSSGSGLNDLSILTTTLPTGTIDRVYSRTLEVSGGAAPFSWDVSAGTLPDGLKLNSATGEISGTPTLQGEETFTVRATDSQGKTITRTLSITVNRTDTDLTILTPTLPLGISNRAYVRTACGVSYTGQLTATGGDGTFNWSVSTGNLPPGLTLSSSGLISGTPTDTTIKSYTFTARVQDGQTNSSSKVFTIEVAPVAVHSFTPGSGGEDLRVVLFGEGLNSATLNGGFVSFGGTNSAAINHDGSANDDLATVGDCERLLTHVPAGAKTGSLTIKSAGNVLLGTSLQPFVAEDVVINEVFLTPETGKNQFVELKNQGTSSVSVAGWQLHYTDNTGALAKFTIPSETPPLNPGQLLTINVGVAGATSATNVYTGTSLKEMRFDPLNAAATSALTQIGLCAGDCQTVGTDVDDVAGTSFANNFRDYLQFGPAANTDPTAAGLDELETNAVNGGLWTNDSTINLTNLTAPLGTVGTDPALADAAHYGVSETGRLQSGLLVQNGNTKFDNYSSNTDKDVVLYFTPTVGSPLVNQQQRVRRTVTGTGLNASALDDNRVLLNSPVFEAKIQATNTGNGSANNGILVDSTNMLSTNNFVNILNGGTIRTVQALVNGPKIEINPILSATVQNTNNSDGVNQTGFLLDNAALLSGSSSLNITFRTGASQQNIVRTPTSINTATNRVIVNQALVSANVDAANAGDGTPGRPIILSSSAGLLDNDRVLFNGQTCIGGALCIMTLGVGSNQVQLSAPLAQMQIHANNVGDGTPANPLTVNTTTGFVQNSKVLINGLPRNVAKINPQFGATPPSLELDTPFNLAIANTNGDGLAGSEILVPSANAFPVGALLKYRDFPNSTVAQVLTSPTRVRLAAAVGTMTLNGSQGTGAVTAPLVINTPSTAFLPNDTLRAPTGKIATITNATAPIGTSLTLSVPLYRAETVATGVPTTTMVPVANTAGFVVNNFVEISGEIRQINAIAGNTLTLAPALTAAPGAATPVNALLATGDTLNLVPTTGNFIPVGGGTAYNLNLVPASGTFSIVPGVFDAGGPTESNTAATISTILTSGSIFLAPQANATTYLHKYLSVKYQGTNNQTAADYGNYTLNSGAGAPTAPTPGQ